MHTERPIVDPAAWHTFADEFNNDYERFFHVPGMVTPGPLLHSVLNATEKLRGCDTLSDPRIRVFSNSCLDYEAIEKFCYDTPPGYDVFQFLSEWVGEKDSCMVFNEIESWDAPLREIAATVFIPALLPYLQSTTSRIDWYAFLATEGWTPFGIHDDDEISLVMNLGPGDKDIWVWEPSSLSGLDGGRKNSLSFEHLLPAANHHVTLKPGDFAAIPSGWFHVFRGAGSSALLGVSLYRRDPLLEIVSYLSHRGHDPLEWLTSATDTEAARRRIAAVRRHLDLTLESAAFSTAKVRVRPLLPESGIPQRVRVLLPLLVPELPTLLLANGSTVMVPADPGSETVVTWLRDNPEFTPSEFENRFTEEMGLDAASNLLNRLAHTGVLADAAR
jgi:hypothetical protein